MNPTFKSQLLEACTPGAWQHNNKNTVYALNNSGVNRFSALVRPGVIGRAWGDVPESETKANTILMAHAHVMYEIITTCRIALESTPPNQAPGGVLATLRTLTEAMEKEMR